MPTIEELKRSYNEAAKEVQAAAQAVEMDETGDDTLQSALDDAITRATEAQANVNKRERVERARSQFTPEPAAPGAPPAEDLDTRARPGDEERSKYGGPLEKRFWGEMRVNEPDMYTHEADLGGERSFFTDLYSQSLKRGTNRAAEERIEKHHLYELGKMPEKRAVATATLGGILPPVYLIGMYAKALRNGRVTADQMNHQTLPDTGMSVIIPRLTGGLSVDVQATENTTVATQDPTETDLTVNVRTMAGYSPVSRQTLERNAYRDGILFEDLIARYNARIGVQVISGSGSAGQMLGILSTSGIATSIIATATVTAVWPKITDIIQQINTQTGPLGYVADRIVMHPRRWGFFASGQDTTNRPIYLPAPMTSVEAYEAFNSVAAGGAAAAYGFTGAQIQGLPVYTDANIPTNLGGGTEDRILIFCSQVAHLWERSGDPVTMSFEQTTGTSLQVNLVCYGYVASTWGRYPASCGVISGAGLVTPTF